MLPNPDFLPAKKNHPIENKPAPLQFKTKVPPVFTGGTPTELLPPSLFDAKITFLILLGQFSLNSSQYYLSPRTNCDIARQKMIELNDVKMLLSSLTGQNRHINRTSCGLDRILRILKMRISNSDRSVIFYHTIILNLLEIRRVK